MQQPFYRKVREFVREVSLLLDCTYLKNMRAEFVDVRKWKMVAGEASYIKLFQGCECMYKCLEHLKTIVYKFGLEIFYLVLKSHYPALVRRLVCRDFSLFLTIMI